MSLHKVIQEKLSALPIAEITELLAYKNTEAVKNRIDHVMATDSLGLDDSYYDFKYSNTEFLQKLLEVLGVPLATSNTEIERIKALITEKQKRYKAYVFVDTDFVRSGQTIISIAALQSRRFIYLPDDLLEQAFTVQLEAVTQLVKYHFKRSKGKLSLFGDIKRYQFFYAEDRSVVLSCDGDVISNGEAVAPLRATLKVGNHSLVA